MTLLRGAAVFVASMLLIVASPVAAEDGGEPLSPPLAFTATYNHTSQETHLQWEAPSHDGGYTYRVYLNGVLIASILQTNHSIAIDPGSMLADALHVVHVTAQRGDVEGPAAPPLLLLRGPLDDYMPPECDFIIVSVQPNNPPFVFVTQSEACREGWDRYIQYMIDELTESPVSPGGSFQLAHADGVET